MKTIRKRLYGIDSRLRHKHSRQHKDNLNADIQRHLNDYDHEGDCRWKGYLHYWHGAEHRSTNGFCSYCDECWGGCEASGFDPTGYCPNCRDESKCDLGAIAEPMKAGIPGTQEK